MKKGLNININIQKKHIWFLTGLIVLLVVIGFTIAATGQGASKNPGHDLNTIQGYNSEDLDLGDTIEDLYSKSQIGSITYDTPEDNKGNTLEIPESVIIDYCADEDGCQMRLSMYDWGASTAPTSRSFLFYYNQENKRWRASTDTESLNNDLTTAHVYAVWSCYFTDGEYNAYTDLGDNDLNFGLLTWNTYPGGCRLTIFD